MADETSMLPWEVPDSGGPGLNSKQFLGARCPSHSSMFDMKSVQLSAVVKATSSVLKGDKSLLIPDALQAGFYLPLQDCHFRTV